MLTRENEIAAARVHADALAEKIREAEEADAATSKVLLVTMSGAACGFLALGWHILAAIF